MHSDKRTKMCFHAAVSVAWLAAAGVALHGGIIEANAQEAVNERIQGDIAVEPVTDVQTPPDIPALPSYYQDETAQTKQRGLDRKEVEQAQDRYYREQFDNAQKRSETMEREADEYYGRK